MPQKPKSGSSDRGNVLDTGRPGVVPTASRTATCALSSSLPRATLAALVHWPLMRLLRTSMVLSLAAFACAAQTCAERLTVSLDGEWRIADRMAEDTPPRTFAQRVPVPGLANLAQPGLEKVDSFYACERLAHRIRAKLAPTGGRR